jgi:multicomponent Na+:H+ antiporter subunit C
MLEFIVSKYNFWVYIILMMIGFYAMIAKKNFVKKIIGMNIFQTSIILFYISLAYKKGGATLPILLEPRGHGAGHHAVQQAIEVSHYINPLPHVLMLTAIVVMVATLGVALAIVIQIYRKYGTLNEDEIIKR